MGGGYKDYYGDDPNYWLTVQKCALPRFYSGATCARFRAAGNIKWRIEPGCCVLYQHNNIIYIGSHLLTPIYAKEDDSSYPLGVLVNDEIKSAILDLLPESWLTYMQNAEGINFTNHVYQYNHDDLVADGIEQS